MTDDDEVAEVKLAFRNAASAVHGAICALEDEKKMVADLDLVFTIAMLLDALITAKRVSPEEVLKNLLPVIDEVRKLRIAYFAEKKTPPPR